MQNEQTPNKFLVPGAIVVAGALVALAIYSGGTSAPVRNTAENAPTTIPAVRAEDHYLGSADAEIVIVEYSDTECPFCKNFHFTMKQVLQTYPDKVAWVYRHFPIPSLHERAMKEAEATECAAELGGNQAFWKYLDEIFIRTNSNDSLDPSELPIIAGDIGLNVSNFNTCLNSGRYTEKVQKSMEEAVKSGARGTPYPTIITKDGKQTTLRGAEPFESVKAKIDSLIK